MKSPSLGLGQESKLPHANTHDMTCDKNLAFELLALRFLICLSAFRFIWC